MADPGREIGEAERGDRLVEQPVPGGVGRNRLLEEQLLGPVVELSTKPARLATWTREAYESAFSKNSSA